MKISNVLKLFASVLMLSFGTSAIADVPKDNIKTEVNSLNTLEIFICIISLFNNIIKLLYSMLYVDKMFNNLFSFFLFKIIY